jgi:hypothetical protein
LEKNYRFFFKIWPKYLRTDCFSLKDNLGKLASENFAKDNMGKSHLSL